MGSASKALKLVKRGFREDDILPQREEQDIEDSLAQDKSIEDKWWSQYTKKDQKTTKDLKQLKVFG